MERKKKYLKINHLSNEDQSLEEWRKAGDNPGETLQDYLQLFEKMPLASSINKMICNENGQLTDFIILDFNQAFGRQVNLNREDAVGRKASEIFTELHPDWMIRFAEIEHSETPITFNDFSFDSMTYFELSVFPTLPGHLVFCLKESQKEKNLQHMIACGTNVFFSHTADYQLRYLSPQVEDLLGYTYKEITQAWTKFLSPNPLNKIGTKLTRRAIETGKAQRPFEMELVRKNGKLVWVEVRQVPVVENGKTVSVIGAMVDITKQKKTNEQLLENKRGLLNFIDESPTPIVINNKKGNIEYLNNEFTKTFGYSISDISHNDQWFKLAYPDRKYREEVKRLWQIDLERRLKRNATQMPFEVNIICKDGSSKFVQIMWSYIGQKLVQIFYDFTQHKRLEDQITHKNDELENALNELRKINEELEKATQKAKESDRLKSAFLANMSHEIRTPMNSIIGFSSLLSLPGTDDVKREKYTDFIQKSGKHLLRIIDDIIDIAKIESNQLKITRSFFSVVPFLENTFDYHRQSALLKTNTELEFILDHQLAGKTVIIFTDPIRLKQVFDNMLTNSIKNTVRGTVKFGIHKIEGNCITFYVSDTGIGIPEKFKKSVFTRFTQAETRMIKPGTGLGLSIIKGITNLLEGEIWFDSTENVGTTFYVKLPILPEE